MVITAQDAKLKPGYKQTEVGVIPEDWNVRALEELGEFKNGINKGKTEFGHGFPFVNLLDVFGVIKVSNDSGFGLVNSTDIERNVYSLKKGDVLFVRSSVKPEGVGLTTLVAEDLRSTVYSGFLIRFRDRGELVFEFKEHCFGEFGFRKRLIANSTVSANTNINQNALKNLQIAYPPSKEEQTAIATALSDVDALITSLEKLIAKKRDIKQATMQQLLTGKKRLPGFSGEWEVRKMEEIGEKFVNGGTPSTLKPEYWHGNIPWITGADVINQKISDIRRFITSEAVKNSSTNIVERDNLLLVTRTGVGKLAVAPFDVAISQDITGIYVNKGQALVEYLFHYFNYNSESLKSLNQGTSIAGITRETLLSTNVYLPSFLEQKAIANTLTDMDAEIAALGQKRDKTRALKQGMMQELLTGKTRLL